MTVPRGQLQHATMTSTELLARMIKAGAGEAPADLDVDRFALIQ
jgi:hypothetical protein